MFLVFDRKGTSYPSCGTKCLEIFKRLHCHHPSLREKNLALEIWKERWEGGGPGNFQKPQMDIQGSVRCGWICALILLMLWTKTLNLDFWKSDPQGRFRRRKGLKGGRRYFEILSIFRFFFHPLPLLYIQFRCYKHDCALGRKCDSDNIGHMELQNPCEFLSRPFQLPSHPNPLPNVLSQIIVSI